MDCTIHELPLQERPREKLLSRGVSALSNAELIAILLRTGTRGANVIALAEQLLQRFGSFAGLARTPVLELAKVKGIGLAKGIQLAASFAVGARLAAERIRNEVGSRIPSRRATRRQAATHHRARDLPRNSQRKSSSSSRDF